MDGPCGRVWASQSQGQLSVFLGEVSHFSESVHILSLGTRAKSHFLPLSHAPSSHRSLQNLSRSPPGESWSHLPLPRDQGDSQEQAWQGREMRDGAPALFLSYPTGFSGPLAVPGDRKWLGFRARWRAASRLAQRAWPMRYSLSLAMSDRRKSNSRRVLLSDMPSRSCFPPSWVRNTRERVTFHHDPGPHRHGWMCAHDIQT